MTDDMDLETELLARWAGSSIARVRRGGGHMQPLFDQTKELLAERGVTVKWDAETNGVCITLADKDGTDAS